MWIMGRRIKYGTSSISRISSSLGGGLFGSSDIALARGLRQANASAGGEAPSSSLSSVSLRRSLKNSRSRSVTPLCERNSFASLQPVHACMK